jgi:hypothetical protein
MANNQDSIDYHNARNGDLTSTSWPGQVRQHANWQEAQKRRRHLHAPSSSAGSFSGAILRDGNAPPSQPFSQLRRCLRSGRVALAYMGGVGILSRTSPQRCYSSLLVMPHDVQGAERDKYSEHTKQQHDNRLNKWEEGCRLLASVLPDDFASQPIIIAEDASEGGICWKPEEIMISDGQGKPIVFGDFAAKFALAKEHAPEMA